MPTMIVTIPQELVNMVGQDLLMYGEVQESTKKAYGEWAMKEMVARLVVR